MEAAAAAVVPAGFRFLPTDWEIINYLRDEQMTAESMRLGFIRDIDLYAVEPWKLWEWFSNDHQDNIIHGGGGDDQEGYGEDCLYFFTPLKKKSQNGTRVDRTVVVKTDAEGSSVRVGTWKLQSAPVDITDSMTGMPVGVKKAATFVPTKMAMKEDTSSSSCCSSSKKRKKAPEEMQGISYIMHEYTCYPSDNQIYSLCRIKRKIDKKMMIKTKKMRRSSPSTNTTNTTTTNTCCREVVQDQEERAAGYDHDDQYHHQEVLYNGEISCDDFVLSGEQQQQQPVVVSAEKTATGVSSENIHHHEENNIWYNDGLQQQQQQQQQQQEAVVSSQGDDQISDYNKGLASAIENFVCYGLTEEFLSSLKQQVSAPTTGGDNLLY